MIVIWLCPACFQNLDPEVQRNHWILWRNPIFWATYLPLAFMVLSGKWLHSLWGQGDRVRPDETEEEMRVRMHWIYALDGPIGFLTLIDLADVLFDLPNYEQRKFRDSVLSWAITLAITSSYILANSYFIETMKNRSLLGVRLVIICQTVFAFGLLNMLVAGLIRNKSSHRYGTNVFESWLEYSARLTMVAFMLGAAFVYSRLWNAYRRDYRSSGEVLFHMHGRYLRRECERYAIIPVAAVLMWTLLIVAYYNNDDLFWDALV